MNFSLNENVLYVLNTLHSAGFESYIVGGCVRDILLGFSPSDFDITTSAKPQEVKKLFGNVVETGLKHGTVTVILDGEPFEVTTFRTEGAYTDSRRPDSVNFVSDVNLDLARRDFTVNAMCYSDQSGLIDCFGGQEDIQNKILRAVGNPEARFQEDALRILRLFRFAATLDFNIEKATFDAAIKCAPKLQNVSAERVAVELKKAVMGKNPTVLSALLETGALENLGIKNADLSAIAKLSDNSCLRLFALLHLSGNSAQASAKNLKLSNDFCKYCSYMENIMSTDFADDISFTLKGFLDRFGREILLDGLEFTEVLKNTNCKLQREEIERIIKYNEPYKISHLDISGDDLLEISIKGNDIGRVLNLLIDKVKRDPALNQKQKLLKIAEQNRN